MIDGEDYGLALTKRDDRSPGLHPWALFRKNEFSSAEVTAGFAEEEGDLQREDKIAIEILMEAVVVVLLIFEQKRSRASLTRVVTEIEKSIVLCREFCGLANGSAPLICDEGERRIKTCAKRLDEFGKRVGVVLVFTTAEAVFRHDDPTAKLAGVIVAGDELGTFERGEKRSDGGEAVFVKLDREARPVEGGEFFCEVHVPTLFESEMQGHSDLFT
jgi:hypothetical protein